MTPNRNATIFFQKIYLSRIEDNRNGQIFESFAILKAKCQTAFSFRGGGFAPYSLVRSSSPAPLEAVPRIPTVVREQSP